MPLDLRSANRKRGSEAGRALLWLERLFLALTCLFLFYRLSKITTLSLHYPKPTEDVLFWAMAAVAVARLPFLGFRRGDVWLSLGMAAICLVVCALWGYDFLRFTAVALVGFVAVDYRRVLRIYLPVAGIVLAVAFVAAMTNGSRNLIQYQPRDGLRSSWGICYPTDCSTFVLFTVIALWVLWEGAPGWVMLPVSLVPVALSLFITASRNSLMCGALFCAVIVLHALERRTEKPGRSPGRLRKWFDGLLVGAFPLLAAAMFLLIFLYSRNTGAMARLNDMMSFRLEYSLKAIHEHGIRPFGSEFAQVGYGFSVFPPASYSFIDSSYVLILVRYGWVMLLALCMLWVRLARKAIRMGHRRLAWAMAVIAFHSVMEHHFIELHFNIFLTMLFASLPAAESISVESREKIYFKKKINVATVAALLILAALLWWLLPWAFTRLRTVFGIKPWREENTRLVAVVSGGCVLALLLAIQAVLATARSIDIFGRVSMKVIPLVLVCALIIGAGYVWSERLIQGAMADESAMLDGEEDVMRLIGESATGPVYVDGQPVVYARRFGGVSPTLFSGEDLARFGGNTVIMDAASDHNVMIQSGYRFARISDDHAVYTADPGVIDALANAGYEVTDFFSASVPVDLEMEALQNGLDYDEQLGLLLDGPENTLHRGPREDLYGGAYEVCYGLRLSETAKKAAGETLLCTLRVTTYKGETLVAERPVYRGEFDEEGCLTVTMAFGSAMARNAEFLAEAAEGVQLYVTDIRYRKTRP